jgi:hypothetical protein
VIGEVGISPIDAKKLTFRELMYYTKGFDKNKERDLYNTRMLMWATIQSHSKKKIKITDLFKLPSEIQEEPTIEERKDAAKEYLKEHEPERYKQLYG